jgi:hypothetical protein
MNALSAVPELDRFQKMIARLRGNDDCAHLRWKMEMELRERANKLGFCSDCGTSLEECNGHVYSAGTLA